MIRLSLLAALICLSACATPMQPQPSTVTLTVTVNQEALITVVLPDKTLGQLTTTGRADFYGLPVGMAGVRASNRNGVVQTQVILTHDTTVALAWP